MRAERRRAHTAELVALHIGDEDAVERPVERKAPVANLVDNAELAAELHRADADLQHLGGAELVLALLDQQRGNAAPAEIGGERKPDRPAAGDQNRRLRCSKSAAFRSSASGSHQAASPAFRSRVVQYSQARAIGRGSGLNAPAFSISTGVS